jgi:hypothetical protein
MNGWATLFTFTNAVAFLGWAALAFLPRRPAVHSLILYLGVGILCLAYAAMFVALFGGVTDPARVAGAAVPDLTDYSIAGLRALFMSDGGIVLGWTHYLAFDLFVGLWIGRDADAKGFSRLAQVPGPLRDLDGGPDRAARLARRPRAAGAGCGGMKLSSPAAQRNREPIAAVLADWLPKRGLVLEVASGSGEHAAFLAQIFPALEWQPTDPDPDALSSIEAWRADLGLANLREPVIIDATAATWPVERAEAVLNINMAHISPWEATIGLLDGAARVLPVGDR